MDVGSQADGNVDGHDFNGTADGIAVFLGLVDDLYHLGFCQRVDAMDFGRVGLLPVDRVLVLGVDTTDVDDVGVDFNAELLQEAFGHGSSSNSSSSLAG